MVKPEVDHYGSQYGNFATQLYADIRAATYDRDIGQNGWLTADEQDQLIEWLQVDAQSRLLDVACGSGGPTLRIAERTGCRVEGIDIHPDAVRNAQRLATDRALQAQAVFRQVDGRGGLPYDAASFDAVICVDAINHFPDRRRVFSEWHRVLKPNGRLVFTDPIVVTGPLTHEEIAVRASVGFYLFVPDGVDDEMLRATSFDIVERRDRTENMAMMAARWREARTAHEQALRRIEGDANFEGQQTFFEVCALLAHEHRLSRIAFKAVKAMKPKPAFLGPKYGEQFQDESVAQSYRARPAYASGVFPFLAELRSGHAGPVLELGSGTGHLTLGLAEHVDHIDAVEPSEAMLAVALRRASGPLNDRISWHNCPAEDFTFAGPYSLVAAAESLHWMDWSIVLPRIWASLEEGNFLVIVGRRRTFRAGFGTDLDALIPRFSTNKEYQPYDFIEELESRDLFHEVGRRSFETEIVLGGEDIIEWHHSQNGFSRQRMAPAASRAFDDAVRRLVEMHHPTDRVPIQVETRVVWGRGEA